MKAIWDISNKCNLSCKYCAATSIDKEESLDYKTIMNIIDNFDDIVTEVDLMGGEPFAVNNFVDILSYLNHKKIKINIITNGQEDIDILEEIVKNDIHIWNMQVSIDGFEKENDLYRGNGSFHKALKFLEKAIELESLGKAFKSVGVSSVMTEANCNMMVEFADYIINEINADTISVTPVVVDTKAKSNHVYLDSESELNAYENIALYVRKYNLENRINVNCTTPYLAEYLNYKYGTHFEILPKGCDAGESSVYIDSQGHIKPCRYSDEIASLQCDKVSDIYGKSETFIKLKSNIRPMNCDCIYSKCCNICLLAEKDKLQKSNLCKCIAKRYDISHKATVDQFIFDEPHVFYETES